MDPRSVAARFLDAIDPTAAAKAAAITGQQSPTPEQLAEDSAASAEMFGGGDAEGPQQPPVYEAERPVVDDVLVELVKVVRSSLLGVPVPNGSTTFAVNGPAATCGRPVQIVPAAGGRARRVLIRCGAVPVELFTDSREGIDAVTPASGGYTLPATGVHETATQGPIYASAAAAWAVSVWVDNYPAPIAAV